jgi:hypothetical protein
VRDDGQRDVREAAKAAEKSAKIAKKAAPKRGDGPADGATSAGAGPKLLSGGNPQIAKADGDAPVQAYIAAMPGLEAGRRPPPRRARRPHRPRRPQGRRWNTPFYGVDGQGWFLSFHCFAKYIKVAFHRGAALRPPPPGESKQEHVRYLDIYEDDAFDEALVASWIKQASELPGEPMF